MSGPEQLLFLVIVPVTIVAVIWALASIGGPQAKRRYRPGRPYDFTPVWYLAHHRPGARAAADPDRRALPAGGDQPQGTTGGASDRW